MLLRREVLRLFCILFALVSRIYIVSKNNMLHTTTLTHIKTDFGNFDRDVAERVCYRMVICYPISPN